jgi:hypothetical protein
MFYFPHLSFLLVSVLDSCLFSWRRGQTLNRLYLLPEADYKNLLIFTLFVRFNFYATRFEYAVM